MPALDDAFGACPAAAPPRPWPRLSVDAERWGDAASELASGRWTLVALWGEPDAVHMAVFENATSKLAILSHACPKGSFPSVGRMHPPAIRLERAIADLVGLFAEGCPDTRSWLDHGHWSKRHPLSVRPSTSRSTSERYSFLPADGPDLHQIAVGPVHAGIIEPGHFRFTASGETIVRLEERLGYVHKGIEQLMQGATVENAARLAGRVSGDSTVAYALAFARAVEAACEIDAPPRAVALRAVMAELERIANHLGDIGAICNDAAFALMLAHLSVLRERVLRAAMAAFGHRLMMDVIVPGGVVRDISRNGTSKILDVLQVIEASAPRLLELYDNTTSLQDRTAATGVLSNALAMQFGAGGFVGRASGRDFDCRRQPGYPPYDKLTLDVPLRRDGDVNARLWIRVLEIDQSMRLIRQLLETLPSGPVASVSSVLVTNGPSEGAAMIEGFRGDIFVWLRLENGGKIARCHLRDPSWFQWPLLEAVIEGNIVADFPLCNKSFNCSYSGHDL